MRGEDHRRSDRSPAAAEVFRSPGLAYILLYYVSSSCRILNKVVGLWRTTHNPQKGCCCYFTPRSMRRTTRFCVCVRSKYQKLSYLFQCKYFKSCICINGPALQTSTAPPACRHPDMIACEQSWPSLLCSRSAGLTRFNVRDAV